MTDFANVAVLASSNSSCCPKMSLKNRVIGFFITFCIGMVLMCISFGAMFQLATGNATPFAVFYTLGNVTSLCSSLFLYGPERQWKNMKHPTRWITSLVYMCTLVATIFVVIFISKSWILLIILVAIQTCALIWYSLSYIPNGRKYCLSCLKCACCGDSDDKNSPII